MSEKYIVFTFRLVLNIRMIYSSEILVLSELRGVTTSLHLQGLSRRWKRHLPPKHQAISDVFTELKPRRLCLRK